MNYEYQRNGVGISSSPSSRLPAGAVSTSRTSRREALFLVSLLEHRYHERSACGSRQSKHSLTRSFEARRWLERVEFSGVGSTWPRGSSAFCNAVSTDAIEVNSNSRRNPIRRVVSVSSPRHIARSVRLSRTSREGLCDLSSRGVFRPSNSVIEQSDSRVHPSPSRFPVVCIRANNWSAVQSPEPGRAERHDYEESRNVFGRAGTGRCSSCLCSNTDTTMRA